MSVEDGKASAVNHIELRLNGRRDASILASCLTVPAIVWHKQKDAFSLS